MNNRKADTYVALLAVTVAGLISSSALIEQAPEQNQGHILNEVRSDAFDLFLSLTGQIALTEPNQRAFLEALSAIL